MKNDDLKNLEGLAKELVAVSKTLADGSMHDISLSELKELQEKQSSILKKIEKLKNDSGIDHDRHSHEMTDRIKTLLLKFEENNRIYIKNVKRLKGMIHLEGKSQED